MSSQHSGLSAALTRHSESSEDSAELSVSQAGTHRVQSSTTRSDVLLSARGAPVQGRPAPRVWRYGFSPRPILSQRSRARRGSGLLVCAPPRARRHPPPRAPDVLQGEARPPSSAHRRSGGHPSFAPPFLSRMQQPPRPSTHTPLVPPSQGRPQRKPQRSLHPQRRSLQMLPQAELLLASTNTAIRAAVTAVTDPATRAAARQPPPAASDCGTTGSP